MSPRWMISLLVLLLQAAGLVHLCLEKHLLANDGTWHDAHRLVAEAHEGDHVCSPDEELAESPVTGCAVLATWNTPGTVKAPFALVHSKQSIDQSIRLAPEVIRSLDVLSVAPKSSPPRNS